MTGPLKPVSILLVTSSYLPIMGGSEIEAQRVSRALIARGHKVQIVCPGGPPMPEVSHWVDDCGVPVRILGGHVPARIRGHIFALGVAWLILTEFRNFDLVYFLMPGLQVACGTLASVLAGKPLTMKFSGSNEIRRLKDSLVGRTQLRWLDRWAGAIMILNPGMKEEAAECGLRPSKLLWMPNPVDPDEFRPLNAPARAQLRAKLDIADDTELILFVGRLAPEKELGSLIGGFAQIAKIRPRAKLVLAGDGPLREELQRLAESLLPENRIRFAGAVPPQSVHEWMQIADVFALVSSLEGLPVSLIEAMVSGVPAIVSDIPANRQLVDDGIEGLVVPLRSEDLIASGLNSILSDEDRRTRMGAAGRARIVASFSTKEVIERYETLFTRLLGKGAV